MGRKLKIATVCGFGIGTSLILKMKVDEVIKKHKIDAEVLPCDVTTVMFESFDICFTSEGINSQIVDKMKCPVIIINNFLDINEIEEKGLEILQNMIDQK